MQANKHRETQGCLGPFPLPLFFHAACLGVQPIILTDPIIQHGQPD